MFKRIIDWVKSLFHEETPEEQDKRIHETIKTWKMTVDVNELNMLYYRFELLKSSFQSWLNLPKNSVTEVLSEDIADWTNIAITRVKNPDNKLKALTLMHDCHCIIAAKYDPTKGGIASRDLRPLEWLKQLAEEEQAIKALKIAENAKEYEV